MCSNYPDGRSVRRTLSDFEWAECGSGVGKIAGSLPAVASNIESNTYVKSSYEICRYSDNEPSEGAHGPDCRNVGV